MNKPVSIKQFLMAVFGITWYEWDENYSGKQKEEIEEEYEYYTEHQEEYSQYFEDDYTAEIPPTTGKYNLLMIADLLKQHGRFEIVSSDIGRYSIDLDGKTYTADVDLDTYSRGAGIEDPQDVKQYEDIMNPVFDQACEDIAWKANH